jgi:hypothetical protein
MTNDYQLLTTYYLLLTTYHLSLTTYYVLLTTLTADCWTKDMLVRMHLRLVDDTCIICIPDGKGSFEMQHVFVPPRIVKSLGVTLAEGLTALGTELVSLGEESGSDLGSDHSGRGLTRNNKPPPKVPRLAHGKLPQAFEEEKAGETTHPPMRSVTSHPCIPSRRCL